MKTEAEGRERREGQEGREGQDRKSPSKKWLPAIATAACVLATLTVAAQAPRTVVLRAARMLDPVAGRIVANPIVVIVGDRIESLGGPVPANATTIDLGDYLAQGPPGCGELCLAAGRIA